MMAENFEDFGIRFVTEGAKDATQDILGFNKALGQGEKSLLDYDKQAKKTSKSDDKATSSKKKFGKQAKLTTGNIQNLVTELTNMSGIGGSLPTMFSSISGSMGAFTLSIGAAVAGVTAFVVLATRSAGLRGVIEGFDELAQSTGQSTNEFLGNLERASAGTVSSTALMIQANLALAGATGEVAVELGQRLPEVLEIARAQSRRTGESVDFLFSSLVRGIKRSSPLLIDNTGLVISVGKANEAYAESIGSTVEQLSEQEKQIALLNATIEAGQSSVDALGQANETAASKIARANSTITNMLDDIGLALQPLFEDILDGVNFLLSGLDAIVAPIAKILQFVLRAFQIFNEGLVFILGGIINGFARFFTFILTPLLGFEATWTNVWNRALVAVTDGFKLMAFGVGAIMGTFANGLLAASATVADIVASIAEIIASFLIGQSPPPRGPLSNIDEGGANVMESWLEGFAGVSLEPVSEVASEVDTLMGDIGIASLPQVEARLAQLDKAVKPFEDRLKIIESQLEAIQAPANAAIDAIERQQNALADAFNRGDEAAAQMIRQLDAQRAGIERNLSLEEARSDNARIQLALARAAQAEERTKLEIRKAELATGRAITKEVKKQKISKVPKGAKAPKGAGGAGADVAPSAGIPGEVFQGQTDVDRLFGEAGDAFNLGFASQLDESNLDRLTDAQARQSDAFAAIADADPVSLITGAFSGLANELQQAIVAPMQDKINAAVNFIADMGLRIVDSDPIGSITGAFNGLRDNLNTVLTTPIEDNVNTAVAEIGLIGFRLINSDPVQDISDKFLDLNESLETNLVMPITDKVNTAVAEIGLISFRLINSDPVQDFANKFSGLGGALDDILVTPISDKVSDAISFLADTANSSSFISQLSRFDLTTAGANLFTRITDFFGDNLVLPLSNAVTNMMAFLSDPNAEGSLPSRLLEIDLIEPFTTFVTDNIKTPMLDTMRGLFALEGEESIVAPFVMLGTTLMDAAGDLLPTITGIFEPIKMWVLGTTDDGGLPAIGDTLIAVFSSIPTRIWGALQAIGGVLWDTLVRPFIEAINVVIRALNELFERALGSGLADFARDVLNIPLPDNVAIDEISTGRPSALSSVPPPPAVQGAADGGLFSGGVIDVGENGQERMASAQPFAVFSNQFSQAMNVFATTVDTLSSIVMSQALTGGSVDNSVNDNSINVTSRGSERNAAQQAGFLASMRAR